MEDRNKLYSTMQAAAIIGITDGRIRQLIKVGIAKPDQKVGGVWLFSGDEIERLRTTKRPPGKPKKK